MDGPGSLRLCFQASAGWRENGNQTDVRRGGHRALDVRYHPRCATELKCCGVDATHSHAPKQAYPPKSTRQSRFHRDYLTDPVPHASLALNARVVPTLVYRSFSLLLPQFRACGLPLCATTFKSCTRRLAQSQSLMCQFKVGEFASRFTAQHPEAGTASCRTWGYCSTA